MAAMEYKQRPYGQAFELVHTKTTSCAVCQAMSLISSSFSDISLVDLPYLVWAHQNSVFVSVNLCRPARPQSC